MCEVNEPNRVLVNFDRDTNVVYTSVNIKHLVHCIYLHFFNQNLDENSYISANIELVSE